MSGEADPTPVAFLQLLGDPIRWRLMEELAQSDRRVHELTAALDKPQNLVSYHLRALRDAGLASARRSSFDGRDTYYRADLGRCSRLLSSTGTALSGGLRLQPGPVLPPGRRTGRAPRLLFLCTGNSARSQMAEALARERSDGAVDARSAGSHPKELHPNASRVLAERGIDIADQTPKHLRQFARTRFDRVVTLCDRVREVCPEFPGGPEHIHWSIGDPALEGDTDDHTYPAFERTAQELEERIAFLLADLFAPHPSLRTKEQAHV